MAVVGENICSLYEGLSRDFLYRNNLNSIHILLNLYDIEDNIKNISPKYMSIKYLKRQMNKYLRNKKGRHLITMNLGQLIHDDINRLELFIYLEGYRTGYYCNHWANIIEKIAVTDFSLEDLYKAKYLYHFSQNASVSKVKDDFFMSIFKQEKDDKYLLNKTLEYGDRIIKKKIHNLNKYLDKQLTIDYNENDFIIKEDNGLLTLDELNNIYKEVMKALYKFSSKLYKEAYWYGLNDRVLKRYR